MAKTLGERLKQERMLCGLSLRQLDKILDISFSTLARIERGNDRVLDSTRLRVEAWLAGGHDVLAMARDLRSVAGTLDSIAMRLAQVANKPDTLWKRSVKTAYAQQERDALLARIKDAEQYGYKWRQTSERVKRDNVQLRAKLVESEGLLREMVGALQHFNYGSYVHLIERVEDALAKLGRCVPEASTTEGVGSSQALTSAAVVDTGSQPPPTKPEDENG